METSTTSVGDLKATQMIWADWMEEATEDLTDQDVVEVDRKVTPFGTYLMAIRRMA